MQTKTTKPRSPIKRKGETLEQFVARRDQYKAQLAANSGQLYVDAGPDCDDCGSPPGELHWNSCKAR